jgi:hypothetical protein
MHLQAILLKEDVARPIEFDEEKDGTKNDLEGLS